MRKFKCLECGHLFEIGKDVTDYHCPKCMSRMLSLLEGDVVKGKRWGSKSFSVPGLKK